MKKMKRGFSLLLSAALVLGMVPVQGFAADCQHTLTYSAEGTCITAACGNEGCTYRETATLELDKEASLAYTGEEIKPLKVVYSDGWQGEKTDVITYVNNIEVTELQEAAAEPVMEETPEEAQPAPEEITPEGEAEPADNTQEQDPPAEKPEEPKIPTGKLTIGGVSVTKTFAIVEKETLIVTATATVSYGDEKPKYKLVCKDAEGNEKTGIITVTDDMFTSTYTQGDAANTEFDIMVNIDGATSDQYELVVENGKGVVAPRKLAVALDSAECTYDGQEHTPKVVVDNLVGEDDVEADYEPVTAKNAGEYKIVIKGWVGEEAVLKNYELPAETELVFTVHPRAVEFKLDKAEYVYNGQPQTPVVTIDNLVEGDQLELDYDPVTETNPDEYTITIKSFKPVEGHEETAKNYELPDDLKVPFVISKAEREAPKELTAVAESALGSADGRITGVDSTMEYKNEADGADAKYTKVQGEEITGLEAGNYLIRYAAQGHYNASADIVKTVGEGESITVTLPKAEDQNGYTIEHKELEKDIAYDTDVELTFKLDGSAFIMTKDFAIKVTDAEKKEYKVERKENEDGTYTVTIKNIHASVIVDVLGVVPAITMELQGKQTVLEGIIYTNEEQTLTISSELGTEGIYYAEATVGKTLADITEWIAYKEPVPISNGTDRKVVIYAKQTNDNGEVYYATVDVVFDNTPPTVGIKSGKYYTTQKVTIADNNLAEVTVETTVGSKVKKETFTPDDGKPSLRIELKGDTDASYKIVAKDKVGNVIGETSVIRINMEFIATLKESETGLNSVANIRANQCDNATEAEKAALDEIKTNKDAYLVILKIKALPATKDIKPYDEETIDTYRANYEKVQEAYDALSDAQQKDIVGDDNKKSWMR